MAGAYILYSPGTRGVEGMICGGEITYELSFVFVALRKLSLVLMTLHLIHHLYEVMR